MNTFADANAAKAALDRARSLVTESAPDSSLVDRIQRVDVTVDDGEDGWGISGADRARHAALGDSAKYFTRHRRLSHAPTR